MNSSISDNSRVWVYLSDKELSAEEEQMITADLHLFLTEWKAHGTPLATASQLTQQRFIIIAVDEDVYAASGCSIDKQLQFIKETEKKYNIHLLNRLLVAYQQNNKVEVIHSSKVQALLNEGVLNENTLVYNTAVSTGKEFKQVFVSPLKQTWLNRFITHKV